VNRISAIAVSVVFLGLVGASASLAATTTQRSLPQVVRASPLDPPPSRPCPPGSSDCLRISRTLDYPAFLRWTGNDVEGLWRSAFEQAKIPWRNAQELLIPPSAFTRCGGGEAVAANGGPFYCGSDGNGRIYLPLTGLKEIAFPHSSYRSEDFALSTIVAHEWGHHVERLLGFNGTSKQVELGADCLAGVWAYSAWARQLLQPGDINEAIDALNRAGDPPGTSPADAHGSAAERVAAFKRGYTTGRAAGCLKR
jgi:predicted metalloprotease